MISLVFFAVPFSTESRCCSSALKEKLCKTYEKVNLKINIDTPVCLGIIYAIEYLLASDSSHFNDICTLGHVASVPGACAQASDERETVTVQCAHSCAYSLYGAVIFE